MTTQSITLGVDCRALLRPRSGIRSYLEGVLEGLSERTTILRYVLFKDFPDPLDYEWMDERHEQVHVPIYGAGRQPGRNLLGPLWLHVSLPRYIRQCNIDVFWTPEWALPGSLSVPGIITVHDLIPLEMPMRSHPVAWRLYYRISLRHGVRHACHVVVDAERTRQQVAGLLGVPHRKTTVIPLGVDSRWYHRVAPEAVNAVRSKHGIDGNMLLTVGELSDRKNAAVLIAAMASLPREVRETTHLVVVGPDGCDATRIKRLRDSLSLQDRVHFAGYVDDRDLPAYFAAASVFVFPSLAEGFGLPPLEAMAMGLPVICSNATCLPETVGKAAILVPPDDPQAWAAAISNVLRDRVRRHELVALGLQHVRQFSWLTAATQLEKIVQLAVADASDRPANA